MEAITFGIVTVSDTCFQTPSKDKSGPALSETVLSFFPNAEISAKTIVPDDDLQIRNVLLDLCKQKCNVVLTTGGTGVSPRDVTPEATRAVVDREIPGLTFAMLTKSLEVTSMAMLSRPVCGIKNETLIINLPGSVKGATECFGFVKDVVQHAVALITDDKKKVQETHKKIQTFSHSKVKTNMVADRKRTSPYPMLEVKDALELIKKHCPSPNTLELIDIQKSLNRVIAEHVISTEPFPPFPASIKDGYAVKASDRAGTRTVRSAISAGDDFAREYLKCGEIVRISTGAPVPLGADAVVQVEDTALIATSTDGSEELEVEIKIPPRIGQDIRPVGSDLPSNSLVMRRYERVTPGHIGILATIGKCEVLVFKRPTIGVVSTGNELQTYDEQLRPGHIRDSNKLTLLNLLRQHSYEAHDCGIARDEPDCVKRALMDALSRHDVVITTGGVSMGEFDLVKRVLEQDFDATIHFGRVNMKPGKPTTFATCVYEGKNKVVFGLPGNPVSATVTSILFVIPALRMWENSKQVSFSTIPITMGETVELDVRPEYRRMKLEKSADNNCLIGHSTGDQISSRLNSFVGASALAILPGRNEIFTTVQKGDVVQGFLIDLNLDVIAV